MDQGSPRAGVERLKTWSTTFNTPSTTLVYVVNYVQQSINHLVERGTARYTTRLPRRYTWHTTFANPLTTLPNPANGVNDVVHHVTLPHLRGKRRGRPRSASRGRGI
ncbi:hypothetical protein [Pedobacter endophyticus]|uniref:Uncharacterized protein n=1 Tax=Pedobacter endophyticus TaxID=2789740 RepID=A0A7S9KZN6_9SPHI|nr:hypothetical protein [Pedobacter endophyticus]QPH39431.1 hypothetical protein IZT61_20705 [Pedobacter endophyticus]